MFVGSFIIQYLLMPPIMVNSRANITYDIGNVYLATIMALLMISLEVMMHDHQYNVLSLHLYGYIIVGVVLFIYLYRKQIGINDKQYLEGMIQHHSMAIFTSEEILKKTDNYEVAKLAKNIVQNQEDEINVMKKLIEK
jgi:Ca2+/Na+ antiporter